jgi:hypothetical protein
VIAATRGRKARTPERAALLAAIGARLRELRRERSTWGGGPRVGNNLPRRLRIPIRTWYQWERGNAIAGDALLQIIVATGVRPAWLLYGAGPMFDDVATTNGVHHVG